MWVLEVVARETKVWLPEGQGDAVREVETAEEQDGMETDWKARISGVGWSGCLGLTPISWRNVEVERDLIYQRGPEHGITALG
jgi:hypothetical protein